MGVNVQASKIEVDKLTKHEISNITKLKKNNIF